MAVPQFDVVVDGIVATLRNYTGLSAPGGSGVPVYDGPVVSGNVPTTWVAVGYTADDGEQITVESEWGSLGPSAAREETISVSCFLVAQDGGGDFSTQRTLAASTLGLVSDALRADKSLGVTEVQYVELLAGSVRQGVSAEGGAFVELPFIIQVRTYI